MKFTRSTISQLFAMVALATSGAAFASGTHAGGHGDGGETAIGKPGVAGRTAQEQQVLMAEHMNTMLDGMRMVKSMQGDKTSGNPRGDMAGMRHDPRMMERRMDMHPGKLQ